MGNTSLWNSVKDEFKKENFSLNFENNSQFLQKDPEEILEYFHSSIWPCCNRFIYLIYRIAIAVYYTIWFIESIVRNAEYRAQNFIMSNKQKTNILHLHPWPMYMTSWSLTILFIHLWLSAFIALYFYSISEKSRLAYIFTCLFGPFSCSKHKEETRMRTTAESKNTSTAKKSRTKSKPNRNRRQEKTTMTLPDDEEIAATSRSLETNITTTTTATTKNNNNDDDSKGSANERFIFVRLYRVVFDRIRPVRTDEEAQHRVDDQLEKTSLSHSKRPIVKEPEMSHETKVMLKNADFPKSDPLDTSNDVAESLLSKSTPQGGELGETTVIVVTQAITASAKSSSPAKETYCVKKSACEYPSASASDAQTRSQWIKHHVPNVILVLIKISWLLYNQIVISAIVVTVIYFTYVFVTEIETEPTWFSEIGNYHRHGVNSIVAIVDIVLLAYPVRILHFVYTVAYGWVYALVTFGYWWYDPAKNIVYQEIDYSRPLTIFAFYTFLTTMTFVLQVFHFFAYKLKLFLRYEYNLFRESCLRRA